MHKLVASLCIGLFFFNYLHAQFTPRDFLTKRASPEQVQEKLVTPRNWVPYPAYHERLAWNELAQGVRAGLLANAEELLSYKWQPVTASQYLAFERTGSRIAMEEPFLKNTATLNNLMLAELVEGKGRFMTQIIDGVWHTCDMESWVLSAHLITQQSKRALPNPAEQIIDLTSGDVGSLLAWGLYFFKESWDVIDPVIAERVLSKLKERIMVPFMERSDFWWQAFRENTTSVNNWNPWCNENVLLVFLLVEKDEERRAKAVYKTMQSVDRFLNFVKEDGACEEGPSYWGHAAGKLYDYLQILYYATNGYINCFDLQMVKDMGEYIAKSYVGAGWVVNFADASARTVLSPGLVYRYGKAVGSNEMKALVKKLIADNTDIDKRIVEGRDVFRSLENIGSTNDIQQLPDFFESYTNKWYPQTEFCYMKNNSFFFAAKGGHNGESHNHNDIGTFSLYVNEMPFLIDVGVGTYTKQTFGKDRYSIWTMQSNYHNLPLVNGKPQLAGAQYRSSNVRFNAQAGVLSMDISGAYGKEALLKSWIRSFTLKPNELSIEDDYRLESTTDNLTWHFMTWVRPEPGNAGEMLLENGGTRIVLQYDPKKCSPLVEEIPVTDGRLSAVWGGSLFRLVLRYKQVPAKKDKIRFTIKKLSD